jgi:hypothetical protein
MQQAGGDQIVRIFGQFMLGDVDDDVVDGARADGEQQHAADQLEQTVESFGDDADLEGAVEQVTRLEPGHSARSLRAGASRRDGAEESLQHARLAGPRGLYRSNTRFG